MVRGSCLCGGIQVEAEWVSLLRHCHCSMCRKETGSAFGTVAVVKPADFRFARGEELVQSLLADKIVIIPAGTLDDDPGLRPVLHQSAGSKAPRWEIADSLPQFEKWVPGYEPEWAGRKSGSR
jgi:hypothetical protein